MIENLPATRLNSPSSLQLNVNTMRPITELRRFDVPRFFKGFSAAVTLLLSAAGPVRPANLFSESFDTENVKVELNNGAGMTVTYVDYSAMTVGALTHNITEAPRQIAGSSPHRGVLIKADYAAVANDRNANLVALDDVGGSRLSFSDNYRLKFDVYLRLSPAITLHANGYPNETGTTEHVLWGVGYTATSPLARNWRTSRGSGMWGWLATEGGNGAANGADASLYMGPTLIGGRNMDNVSAAADLAAYFTPAFGADAAPVPNCPANQWVEATISVKAGQVTVEYRGAGRTVTKFFENVPGDAFVAGGAMVGYEDSFASVSFDPDNQWMLLDNMVVEDITPPTLVVAPAAPLSTYTGVTRRASYLITNNRAAGDLSVSAVNFSGVNAADFTVVTPLPLKIGPGLSGTMEFAFVPAAPNGIKTATLTIVSDDPQQPEYVISDIKARRSVGTFLEARYALDETDATSVADSSGNNVNAGFQVRDPLVFGKASLLSAADTGTSIGFLPAQTGTSGNYFVSPVVHTPTFSVSLWIKPSAAGSVRTLFQRDHNFNSPYDKICGLLLGADGTLTYRVASTDVLTTDPVVLDDQVWQVVVTHLDSDGFGNATADHSRIYINGLKAKETEAGAAIGFDDYPLAPVVSGMHVGSRTVASFGYSGCIDDVHVYGVELTPEQVWSLFKRPGTTALQAPEFGVILASRSAAPALFSVEFPSSPSASYRLYRSVNLQTWDPVTDSTAGAAGSLTTVLTDAAPSGPERWYRVQRQ